MKALRKTFPELYAKWVNTGWTILTGRPPEAPAKEGTPKAAQVAANQGWEDEGGSIKPPNKPATESARKIPL